MTSQESFLKLLNVTSILPLVGKENVITDFLHNQYNELDKLKELVEFNFPGSTTTPEVSENSKSSVLRAKFKPKVYLEFFLHLFEQKAESVCFTSLNGNIIDSLIKEVNSYSQVKELFDYIDENSFFNYELPSNSNVNEGGSSVLDVLNTFKFENITPYTYNCLKAIGVYLNEVTDGGFKVLSYSNRSNTNLRKKEVLDYVFMDVLDNNQRYGEKNFKITEHVQKEYLPPGHWKCSIYYIKRKYRKQGQNRKTVMGHLDTASNSEGEIPLVKKSFLFIKTKIGDMCFKFEDVNDSMFTLTDYSRCDIEVMFKVIMSDIFKNNIGRASYLAIFRLFEICLKTGVNISECLLLVLGIIRNSYMNHENSLYFYALFLLSLVMIEPDVYKKISNMQYFLLDENVLIERVRDLFRNFEKENFKKISLIFFLLNVIQNFKQQTIIKVTIQGIMDENFVLSLLSFGSLVFFNRYFEKFGLADYVKSVYEKECNAYFKKIDELKDNYKFYNKDSLEKILAIFKETKSKFNCTSMLPLNKEKENSIKDFIISSFEQTVADDIKKIFEDNTSISFWSKQTKLIKASDDVVDTAFKLILDKYRTYVNLLDKHSVECLMQLKGKLQRSLLNQLLTTFYRAPQKAKRFNKVRSILRDFLQAFNNETFNSFIEIIDADEQLENLYAKLKKDTLDNIFNSKLKRKFMNSFFSKFWSDVHQKLLPECKCQYIFMFIGVKLVSYNSEDESCNKYFGSNDTNIDHFYQIPQDAQTLISTYMKAHYLTSFSLSKKNNY